MNGATVGGRKPIVSSVTHDYGTKGGSGETQLKASQIAGEGAKSTGSSAPWMSGTSPSKPALDGAKAAAETQTKGTTSEEQAKKLAGSMYPSSRGLSRYLNATGS